MEQTEDLATANVDQRAQSPWQCRAVKVVVPSTVADAMLRRARFWSVQEGGRFDTLPDRVLLWSRQDPTRLAGSIHIRRGTPTSWEATIHQIAWNPQTGGTLQEMCQAVEILAGVTRSL
jgi:hypothetical protein